MLRTNSAPRNFSSRWTDAIRFDQGSTESRPTGPVHGPDARPKSEVEASREPERRFPNRLVPSGLTTPGRRPALHSARGFTLVEIAIALGVIGFALVAIIGILPVGLQIQRDNRAETIINQDGTFWLEAIRNGAQGMDDLTNWVESIITPEDPLNVPFVFGDRGIAGRQYTYGSNIISLLTTATRFGNTNVQAIVTAFSGSAAEKEYNKNDREISFKYRLSVEITNAASLAPPFGALDPQHPPNEVLDSLYELQLTLSYPYLGKDRETRSKSFRATVSRNVLTNLFAGREYYLFTR